MQVGSRLLAGGGRRRSSARGARRAGRSSSSTGPWRAARSWRSSATALPPTEEDEYYIFQLVGLEVVEENGRALGRVADVLPGVANDVLQLGDGVLLPMVEDCIRSVDLEAGRILVAPGFSPRLIPLQLDVFTLVPHAFAWLTEQRPVATVLGGELDLRLFSYRDTRRCAPARSTTSRTAAAPGMVLRVDVVAAALEADLRRAARAPA